MTNDSTSLPNLVDLPLETIKEIGTKVHRSLRFVDTFPQRYLLTKWVSDAKKYKLYSKAYEEDPNESTEDMKSASFCFAVAAEIILFKCYPQDPNVIKFLETYRTKDQ